ncbi:unnamed protein product [Boreogadus saida]
MLSPPRRDGVLLALSRFCVRINVTTLSTMRLLGLMAAAHPVVPLGVFPWAESYVVGFTDASLTGWGGTCLSHSVGGEWLRPPTAHINVLELATVRKVLHLFRLGWKRWLTQLGRGLPHYSGSGEPLSSVISRASGALTDGAVAGTVQIGCTFTGPWDSAPPARCIGTAVGLSPERLILLGKAPGVHSATLCWSPFYGLRI